jgi:hypothetical protein
VSDVPPDGLVREERGQALKNGPDLAQRRKVADCVRLLLAGKVSCDHVLEEFGSTGDDKVQEILTLIEETAGREGRYRKIAADDRKFLENINRLLNGLLAGEKRDG